MSGSRTSARSVAAYSTHPRHRRRNVRQHKPGLLALPPALADTATIDASTGPAGTARQLNASPQTATTWQWTLIRQPAASTARLSSVSIRNPYFTPDVADLYIFQLTASDGKKTSITTVSLTATAKETPPAKP